MITEENIFETILIIYSQISLKPSQNTIPKGKQHIGRDDFGFEGKLYSCVSATMTLLWKDRLEFI